SSLTGLRSCLAGSIVRLCIRGDIFGLDPNDLTISPFGHRVADAFMPDHSLAYRRVDSLVNGGSFSENLVDVLAFALFHTEYLSLIRSQVRRSTMDRSLGPSPAAIKSERPILELSYTRRSSASGR